MIIHWKKIKEFEAKAVCSIHKNKIRRAYCRFVHGFIPHHHNSHWPHILRPKALLSYGVFLILVKLAAAGILFISFPDQARLSQEIIDQMLKFTNQTREEYGLPPLNINAQLSKSANIKAQDMANKGYFSHYTPEGYAPWYFIDENEYNYQLAGENLAMNFTKASVVQQAFMASPGHRENILHPDFEDIGLAVVYTEMEGRPTQIMVEYFGRLQQQSGLARVSSEKPSPTPTATTNIDLLSISENPEAKIAGETTESGTNKNFSFSKELIIFQSASENSSMLNRIYNLTHSLFIFFFVFLAISLLINIIVKINIQHGRLILQSLLVIVLSIGLLYVKIHFLEDINLTLQIN